jgi:hypothetical protein
MKRALESFMVDSIYAWIHHSIHLLTSIYTQAYFKKGLSFVVHGYRALESDREVNTVYSSREV